MLIYYLREINGGHQKYWGGNYITNKSLINKMVKIKWL